MQPSIHGHRRSAALVLALSASLALAACGSSSSGGTKASTATPVASATGAATTAAPASSDAAGSGATAASGQKATGSTIKIGLINPEGGSAVSIPDAAAAAKAAAAYANDNLGGIAGHVISVDYCPEKEDTASVQACGNQMVSDKVAAVVVTTTALGDTLVPIITGAGIPYFTASGQSNDELGAPNAFSLTGGFPATLIAAAKYSAGKGYKNVTAYVSNVPAAVGGTQQLGVPTFKAAGVTLKVVPIPLGTPDATSQVTAGLSGAQGALVIGDATECTSVLKALSTLGASLDKLLIQTCVAPSVFQAVGSLDGAHVFSFANPSGTGTEAKLYASVMKQYAPNASAAGYAVVGYQGMLGLIRAAQTTTDTTAAAVLTAIKAAKGLPVPAADGITFTCDGAQFPKLTALCGTSAFVSEIKGAGVVNTTVVS